MKKTISISLATLALSASASALVGPIGGSHGGPHMPSYESKTYCLSIHEDAHGAKTLGQCDESANNHRLQKPLNSAGCAHGQAALIATRKVGGEKPFSPQIKSCVAPNIAQL